MFRWWIDSPGDIPKIVCHECGFGYAEGEDIIKGEALECPRCHKKEMCEMEICTIPDQKENDEE
jgi:DNA-directed RNA polymerase subunit RPC12/RpoP